MGDRLEISQWISLNHPVYAVALTSNGQYIAAGSQQGVGIFNPTGQRLFTYPAGAEPLPVRQLAATPNMEQLYIGALQGDLIRLELQRQDQTFTFQAASIYQTRSDLNTLSLSAKEQLIAVGHLSPGLTLMQTDSERIWRRHRDDGTATEGGIWSVAFAPDGEHLYVGNAGSGTNRLAKLTVEQGVPVAQRLEESGITAIAVLPEEKGVVVVLAEAYGTGRLVLYDTNLSNIMWQSDSFDEKITAMAVDSQLPLLAISVGFEVSMIDALSGQVLTSQTSKSIVNDLALVQGRTLAAATEDGHIALMSYVREQFNL